MTKDHTKTAVNNRTLFPQMVTVNRGPNGTIESFDIKRRAGRLLRDGVDVTEDDIREHFRIDNFAHGKVRDVFLQAFIDLTSSVPRRFLHQVDLRNGTALDAWYAVGKLTDDPNIEVMLCSGVVIDNIKDPNGRIIYELTVGLKEGGHDMDFNPKKMKKGKRMATILKTDYDAEITQTGRGAIAVDAADKEKGDRFGPRLNKKLLELMGKNGVRSRGDNVPMYE